MSQTPTLCPACQTENTYPVGALWACAECAHEWNPADKGTAAPVAVVTGVKDAFGTVLADGDAVTLIKDLKIKGAGTGAKVGTKVRNIRLVEGAGGHNIVCKLDGLGTIYLKSEFVRKA